MAPGLPPLGWVRDTPPRKRHLQWADRAHPVLQSSLQACDLAWGGSRYLYRAARPIRIDRWKNAPELLATAASPDPIAVRLTKQRNIGCGSSVEKRKYLIDRFTNPPSRPVSSDFSASACPAGVAEVVGDAAVFRTICWASSAA